MTDEEKYIASGKPITPEMIAKAQREAEEGFDIEPSEVRFGCAFCNVEVPKDEIATFTLTWRNKNQWWFGHAQCFVNALDERYRDLRDEWEDLET